MTREELREKVARALCVDAYKNIPTLDIDEQATDPHWLNQADAAIALVLEEAAEHLWDEGYFSAAAAIRALKD